MNNINKSLTLTGRSGNGSCLAPPGDDMDDTHPCQLHIWDCTEKTLVARGKVFEAATVLHGIELSKDEVKVMVEKVLMPFALVLVPTNEVYTMGQTFQCFLAWPRDLVVSDPPIQTLKPTDILNFYVYMFIIFKLKLYFILTEIASI